MDMSNVARNSYTICRRRFQNPINLGWIPLRYMLGQEHLTLLLFSRILQTIHLASDTSLLLQSIYARIYIQKSMSLPIQQFEQLFAYLL